MKSKTLKLNNYFEKEQKASKCFKKILKIGTSQ